MFRFIKEHSGSLVLAVLLHVVIVVALVGGFLKFRSKPETIEPAQLAIQATVVDEQQVQAEMSRQQQEKERDEREARERADQLRRQQENEQRRLDDLKRQRAAEEETERQRAEQRRVEEQERKQQAEIAAKRKAEADAKAEADRKRRAEAERKQKLAAERRQAEAKAQAEREAALQAKLAEEERRQAAVNSGLLAQWASQVQARVQRAWNRPASAKAGLKCQVTVTWAANGEVLSAVVGECNGDETVRRSIQTAVLRASPLPTPADPSLFQKTFKLEFKPND